MFEVENEKWKSILDKQWDVLFKTKTIEDFNEIEKNPILLKEYLDSFCLSMKWGYFESHKVNAENFPSHKVFFELLQSLFLDDLMKKRLKDKRINIIDRSVLIGRHTMLWISYPEIFDMACSVPNIEFNEMVDFFTNTNTLVPESIRNGEHYSEYEFAPNTHKLSDLKTLFPSLY